MANWSDFETHPVGTADRIKELEAKLGSAMRHVADYSNDPHLVDWANTTLAELKGQADE